MVGAWEFLIILFSTLWFIWTLQIGDMQRRLRRLERLITEEEEEAES